MNEYQQMLYNMQYIYVCMCVHIWVDFFFYNILPKNANFLANPIGVGGYALLQGIFST